MSGTDDLMKDHCPEEDENFRKAHEYMDLYVDSLVDEYKAKKENAYLIQRLDKISGELLEIKSQLAEVREQSAVISAGFQYLDFTRLTIGKTPPPQDDALEDIKRFIAGTPPAGPTVAATAVISQTAATFAPPEAEQGAEVTGASAHNASPKLSDDERFREAFKPNHSPGPDEGDIDDPNSTKPKHIKGKEKGKREKKTGKRRAAGIVANVLFYLCMLLLIVGAVTFSQSDNPEKSLFGYRYYYIKTASMEPVLPVGSVVITKSVPSEEIQVGDDITVYVGDGSSDSYLTHRVVELTTDQSGELAFLTKGVNNKANDPAPFNAKLVVGRVVFCIPKLGVVMTFVQSQLILVIGIFVLLLALSFMLRLLFSKEPKTEGDPKHSGNTAGSKPSGLTGRKKRKKEVSPSPEAKDGTLEEREEEAHV